METCMFGHLSSGHCRQDVKEEPWVIISEGFFLKKKPIERIILN